MKSLLRWLDSLAIAVPLLIAIAAVLAWGTIYEAQFGTAAVQRFIYHAWWFQALLGFLAVNLAVAALERSPWQLRHAPFLMAHLGIILILIGGILGGQFGLDGQLIIPEGQAEHVLRLSQSVVTVRRPNPGVTQIIPTDFETRAWIHDPRLTVQLPLEGHPVQVTVDRYFPNAEVQEEIADGGTAENPAIRVALAHEDQQDTFWLLARDQERFGERWQDAHVLFLEPKTPEQFRQLLGMSQTDPTGRGSLLIELPDLKVQRTIPVPNDLRTSRPLDGTPYTVTFKDYFTDFAITEQGVTNRSDQPNNPAVAFTLSGPEGVDPYLAFALHPDFSALHNQQHTIHAHVTYQHGAAGPMLPPSSIAFLRHPTGALTAVLTSEDGEQVITPVEIGTAYHHPWLDYTFTVEAFSPRAVVVQHFSNRDNEVRVEALHVIAREGAQQAEAWVQRGVLARLILAGKPLEVEYRPAEFQLPFTIKLLDFRKLDYPGTQMASSFEADVELSDPARGLILMRKISMNHPLKYRGFTFYQASYIPGATDTTVLAVRKDPGTLLVYAGFLIVMLGIMTLFVLRSRIGPTTEGAA